MKRRQNKLPFEAEGEAKIKLPLQWAKQVLDTASINSWENKCIYARAFTA